MVAKFTRCSHLFLFTPLLHSPSLPYPSSHQHDRSALVDCMLIIFFSLFFFLQMSLVWVSSSKLLMMTSWNLGNAMFWSPPGVLHWMSNKDKFLVLSIVWRPSELLHSSPLVSQAPVDDMPSFLPWAYASQPWLLTDSCNFLVLLNSAFHDSVFPFDLFKPILGI